MSTRAQKKRYYREDPWKYRARARAHYRANADRIKSHKATWRAAHPDQAAAQCAAFRAANPNYFREYRYRRRLAAAWSAWSMTCAANRRAMEARDVAGA